MDNLRGCRVFLVWEGGESRFTRAKITHWVFVLILKLEKTEDVHRQFQRVLSEISKPNDDYELKIANRLFGEKTYLFLQVSFAEFTTSVTGTQEWPNDSVKTGMLEASCLIWVPDSPHITVGVPPTPPSHLPPHPPPDLFSRYPDLLGASFSSWQSHFCLNPIEPAQKYAWKYSK